MGKPVILFSMIVWGLVLGQASFTKERVSGNVVLWAKALKGTKGALVARDKKFSRDCSNFVRASYYGALGKDLFEESVRSGIYSEVSREFSGGNLGVIALYRLFQKKYHLGKRPRLGDIVFFDNTYDRNSNKKWDDPLSHAGIVTEIQTDGTVVFIHGGTSRGIDEGFLHLGEPGRLKIGDKQVNSYLQRYYSWNRDKKLSGELFRAFGRLKK